MPFLRAKGHAEEAVTASGLQHAVIRSAPVVAKGSIVVRRDRGRSAAYATMVWGPGDRSLAPVAVGDLAAVLAVADDLDIDLAGTWALEGPDAVTADELVEVLAGRGGPPIHLDGEAARAELSASFEREVSRHLVDAITAPARADAPTTPQRSSASSGRRSSRRSRALDGAAPAPAVDDG